MGPLKLKGEGGEAPLIIKNKKIGYKSQNFYYNPYPRVFLKAFKSLYLKHCRHDNVYYMLKNQNKNISMRN